MMKKNNKKTISVVVKAVAAMAFMGVLIMNTATFIQKSSKKSDLSFASLSILKAHADETGGEGDSSCDQCVIKLGFIKVFSCKTTANESCSKSNSSGSVSCANAKAC